MASNEQIKVNKKEEMGKQISLNLKNKVYRQLTRKQVQALYDELINKTPDLQLSLSVFIYKISDGLFLLIDNFNYQYFLIKDEQGEILSYANKLLKDLIVDVVRFLDPYNNYNNYDFDLSNIQYDDSYYFFVYPDVDTFSRVLSASTRNPENEVFSLSYEGEHFVIMAEEYKKGRRYHQYAYKVYVYSPSVVIHLVKRYLNVNYVEQD